MKIAVRSFSGVRSDLSWSDPSDWNQITEFAKEAESLGADSIWTSEAWGTDAITPLAYLAASTTKIRLGTGIVQVGSRTPGNLVMTSLTLQSMSGGRFILGLGTSGPQVIEGFHGVTFGNPVLRTKELLEIIKMGVSGEKLQYKGKYYQLPLEGGEGKAIRTNAKTGHVPVYVASLGPSNLEMTGEKADGWIGGCFIPETGDVFLDKIKAGLSRSGRKIDDIDILIPVSLEFTDEVEEAAKRHARGYGFTFGAMGSVKNNFYKNAYARQGYGEIVDVVQKLWVEGRREEARDMVPNDLALKSNLIGTDEMIKERLLLYKKLGVSTLKVDLPGDDIASKSDALGRLMDLVSDLE
ncbi:MAG: LLM class flavin-dependent oxidoreductase [Chloroflexota bacterium]|nr:LLM class flavin-dependent oxidoreductase [Chloroflexota bacterium]MEC9365706.1 LLM class flavin-dependent oxidoreductase [Chloroflexota bacterium]|tara:strand:- start:775 stop:1833 length:1059 start_codon:yes stop_codon:yes gene_type:complete